MEIRELHQQQLQDIQEVEQAKPIKQWAREQEMKRKDESLRPCMFQWGKKDQSKGFHKRWFLASFSRDYVLLTRNSLFCLTNVGQDISSRSFSWLSMGTLCALCWQPIV